MFRRFVLIVTTLLTVLFVGLWMDRGLRAVSLDQLSERVARCQKKFNRLDVELYSAIRSESAPAAMRGSHRPQVEISAELNRARVALDDAYTKQVDALERHRATGAEWFRYPLQWDLSRFDDRWCFIHITADLILLTYNSTDAVPIRAKWSQEQEMHAMFIAQMDAAVRPLARPSFIPAPFRRPAPAWSAPPWHAQQAASLRAGQRLQSAEGLRELLKVEGCFFNYSAEPTRELILQFPLWIPILLLGAYPAYSLLAHQIRRRVRRARGLCANCRYNLTGNTSGVCPECGTAIASRKGEAKAAST